MTELGSISAAPKSTLPIIASVVRAFRAVVTAPISFAKMALLPALVTAAIIYVFPMVPSFPGFLDGFFLSLLAVPLSYLGFAWLLFSLRKERAGFVVRRHWTAAYLRVLSHCLPWFMLFFGMTIAFMNAESYMSSLRPAVYDLDPPPVPSFFFLWIGVVLLTLYFMARLLLAAPAVAVGYPASPRAAWHLSRGRGLHCFGAALLVFLTVFIGSFIFFIVYGELVSLLASLFHLGREAVLTVPYLPGGFTVAVIAGLAVGTGALAEVLATAFRTFTGWSEPREDILERFE